MYDRQTESWWQQFTGKGIVGQYAGTMLRQLPSEIVAIEDFEAAHGARGRILSRITGHVRPYGRDPYAGYDRIDQHPFLFSGKLDGRLPGMERGLSISAGAKHRLYPPSLLEFEFLNGRWVDGSTGSEWNILGEAIAGPLKNRRLPAMASGVHFSFAWLAFDPDSEIVRSLP